MQEKNPSCESLLESTRQAVDKFGEAELEALVRKVVYRLQRVDASGVFGEDFNYKTLWDEYCHEIQEGPHDLLDGAWNQTVEPILDGVIDRVPRHTAELLSIFAQWELDSECDEVLLASVWPDGIRDVLRDRLDQLAANRNLEHLMT